jgi:integrase
MENVNPRTLINSKKNEYWARKFLEKLEKVANSKEEEFVGLELGDVKRKHKKYILLRQNLLDIIRYAKHLLTICKPVTAARASNLLVYFADFVKKPFKEVKREDIERFFEKYAYCSKSYNNTFARILKPFFRWLYGYGKKDSYPEVVEWIYCGKKRNNQLPEILTMEEIAKMIDACDNLRDRALISILYESGCRASEILDLKIGDLHFDDYGAYLVVNGKTGSRRIRLVSSVTDLKAWLNVHPKKDDANAPLFCALTKNNKGNPLGDSSLDFIVQQIAKKAGISKRVYPHLFRHTRATHLAKHLTEQELKIYFGWTMGSDMPSTYVHLSGKDIEQKILQLSGIVQKEKEGAPVIPTVYCFRCHERNSIGDRFCKKCGEELPSKETIEKIEAVKQVVNQVTMFIFEKMKERKIGEEDLDNVIQEWYEKNSQKNQ